MKTYLRIFAGNNFLIGLGILSLIFSNTNSISIFSLTLGICHLATSYGLLTRKAFGWYINTAASTNIVIIATYAVISTQFINSYGFGGTTLAGKLYGFILTIAVLIAAFSLYRTNKSDIIKQFKVTTELQIAAFLTGIVSATYLLTK